MSAAGEMWLRLSRLGRLRSLVFSDVLSIVIVALLSKSVVMLNFRTGIYAIQDFVNPTTFGTLHKIQFPNWFMDPSLSCGCQL